ncbi:hypothetical protein D9M71_597660 [compost metagenome]
MAAEHLAGAFALQGLDFHLDAEVGDHLPVLLGAEVATFQFLQGARFALGRAGGAFFLDFFDAPALPAGKVTLGHIQSIGKIAGEFSMRTRASR